MNSVIDLFCGPGGLGTGFSKHFEVAEAVDIDADACRTYKANHKSTKVRQKDIRDMSFAKGDYDGMLGVIGGPPCQSFSVLNMNRNTGEERANLVFEMLRALKEIKPEFLLVENVASIPRGIKERLEREVERQGYKVVSKVIFASDYGSVQRRRRWMMTASRKKHIFPKGAPSSRRAKDILDGRPSEIEARPETLRALKSLPVGKWAALPGQTFKTYFVVDEEGFLPAVVNPTKLRYVRPDREGYLNQKELNRAQGFPDTYEFCGGKASWGQQLANAVPVELGEAFAKAFANGGY